MTNHTPQGLPPLLDDLAKWEDQVRRYDALDECNPMANMLQQAREALAAQAATLEAICKIIECAGPEAADEIADLLGYPSVEWPSDQAASVEPAGEVMEGAQTVGFGRKEIQKFAQFDQSLPVGTKLYAGAPPSPASVPATAVMQVGCENIDGTLNIHPEMGTCSICEPAAAVDAVPYATLQEVDRFFSGRLAELGSLSGEATDLHAYVRAALQASHQPQPQQAVAEGAGDGLRQTLIDVGRVIAWQCFGDCRAYDEFGPGSLRGLHEMDAEIRAALATKEPK